ncbi:4-alpha-glucanotransferase [Chlamydiales bacterium SCGC AG-110-M15]|nr:4-alpha-glucanotransferase [Chlamydiales bacterium SCGC AG-110-M15]
MPKVKQNQQLLDSAAGTQWKSIGVKHHHGINIPIFSLRSRQSCGIGEYLDLIPMIEWCNAVGLDVIQILPINDTGMDSSPYNALSAFALNPTLLSLTALPEIEFYPDLIEKIESLQALNHEQRVDYRTVIPLKREIVFEYAKRRFSNFVHDAHFQRFLQENSWLESYGLFVALKEEHDWKSWEEWPENLQNPSTGYAMECLHCHRDAVNTHIAIQYLCFQQMHQVKEKASSLNVLIKGDIPILISRDSADVWLNRNLFKMEFSAGAPPDMYAEDGQNWGFPIYNWEEIEKEDYSWWRQRLQVATYFYHLYRIDHIVGFFRIWAVPPGMTGRDGHFDPEDQSTWIEHGKKIMEMMLESSPMLPIGEDLGAVPPDVRQCLKDLGICGTKVMRWERDWDGDQSYIELDDYPTESMTTVSTHDSETLSQWWKSGAEDVKTLCDSRGWEMLEEIPEDYLKTILWESHHSPSLFHINLLNEYLALVPGMTWPEIEDERINIPGEILDENWSYRYRVYVEEIAKSDKLRGVVKGLII